MSKNLSKKKAREERIRKQKHQESIVRLYPSVIFENTHIASKELVDAVKKAVDLVDFHKWLLQKSPKCEIYGEFMKMLKKTHAFIAFDVFRNKPFDECCGPESNLYIYNDHSFSSNTNNEETIKKNKKDFNIQKYIHSFVWLLGTYIHNKISKDMLKKYLPYEYFRILFINNQICFLFYKLNKHKTSSGCIYTLHFKKTVQHEGKTYELAFTNHALDRYLERHFESNPIDSFIKQDNFYETMQYSRHLINTDNPDNPLIETYVPIISLQSSNNFINWADEYHHEFPFMDKSYSSLLNKSEKYDNYAMRYVKIFYAPVKFENDKAIMITNLIPGFKGTPEYDFWKNQRVLTREDYLMMKDFFSNEKIKTDNERFEEIQVIFYQNNFVQFRRALIEKNTTKFIAFNFNEIKDLVSPSKTKIGITGTTSQTPS